MILFAISLRINRLTCFRRRGDAMSQDQPDMQSNKVKLAGGNNKDMNGKEAAKGGTADGVTSKDKSRQPVTNQGRASSRFGPR